MAIWTKNRDPGARGIPGSRVRRLTATRLTSTAFAIFGLAATSFGAVLVSAGPSAAVVYCTGPGYPAGCVVRPAAPAARAAVHCTAPGYPAGCKGGAPAARATVHCTRPGYPVGCSGGAGVRGVGAPGVGVEPYNRGGPVNRVGVR